MTRLVSAHLEHDYEAIVVNGELEKRDGGIGISFRFETHAGNRGFSVELRKGQTIDEVVGELCGLVCRMEAEAENIEEPMIV